MKKPDSTDRNYGMPARLSFPHDEAIHHWLPMLLEAYHIVDRGIAKAISIERKKGRPLACGKGCAHCCETHKTIPVYPLELVGISWYAAEKISGRGRELLRQRLRSHHGNGPCPFLQDGMCTIHAMRPMGCRQFIVFGMRCAPGEDPYYTRRQDVLTPIQKYADEAFFRMLPFYGVSKESDRRKVIGTGAIHKLARTLHSCSWITLADKMDEFDGTQPSL
ncbi:MAG: YkgJ family cysteine cluster protein [Chloroflexota bacterium]